jgi:hypothetical protein
MCCGRTFHFRADFRWQRRFVSIACSAHAVYPVDGRNAVRTGVFIDFLRESLGDAALST